jgi:hypothetical protein
VTRLVRLVPGREEWSAKEWAEAYFTEVYPTLGVPGAIITDRGSVFVSYFWTMLFEMMGTDCVATTAYNQGADGQSERTNQTIEIALRHVVKANQDNWVDFLGEIQLAANNAVNASTKIPPNEALMAYLPKGADTLVPVPVLHNQKGCDLQEMKAAIVTKREEARDALAFAEFAMAAQHDNKHHPLEITEGENVFIDFAKKDREGYKATEIVSPKLGPQRAGPFRVLEMVGENACRVDIPADWKIWPVISLRNLTKAPDGPDPYTRLATSLGRPTEPEKEPEVILDSRFYKGKQEYWLKWQGLPLSRCSWEAVPALDKWKHMVEALKRSRAPTSGKIKRVGTAAGAVAKKAK